MFVLPAAAGGCSAKGSFWKGSPVWRRKKTGIKSSRNQHQGKTGSRKQTLKCISSSREKFLLCFWNILIMRFTCRFKEDCNNWLLLLSSLSGPRLKCQTAPRPMETYCLWRDLLLWRDLQFEKGPSATPGHYCWKVGLCSWMDHPGIKHKVITKVRWPAKEQASRDLSIKMAKVNIP